LRGSKIKSKRDYLTCLQVMEYRKQSMDRRKPLSSINELTLFILFSYRPMEEKEKDQIGF
jgi:hypothetical protein